MRYLYQWLLLLGHGMEFCKASTGTLSLSILPISKDVPDGEGLSLSNLIRERSGYVPRGLPNTKDELTFPVCRTDE